MYIRWFPKNELVETLLPRLREGTAGFETPFFKDAKQDAMLVGGCIFLFLGAIAALFIFGSGDVTLIQSLVAVVGVIVASAIGAGITWSCMGANNKGLCRTNLRL